VTGPETSPPEFDPQLLPEAPVEDEPQRADSLAAQQFAHGLLRHLHRDLPLVQERRIASVMSAVADEAPAAPPPGFRLRNWLPISGAAAAVFLIAFLLVGPPAGHTALAVVQNSIEASRSAGDRSYRVQVILPPDAPASEQPSARVDLRDADHLVIDATSPHGDRIVVGRNPDGAWAIRPDGSIDRYPPQHAWPRWINFGQSTFLIDSVDSLLKSLPEAYELQLGDPEPLPDAPDGPAFERVTAVHEPRPSPEPRRIELWIDVNSRLVRRMELHWPEWQDGAFADGPPPRDRHPDGPPPPHDGLPDPPPPPPGGARPGGPPAFIDGPPDFAGGRHPPPPRAVLFEMIETEAFPDGWFQPEAHQQP
jgi:hypothetical protein